MAHPIASFCLRSILRPIVLTVILFAQIPNLIAQPSDNRGSTFWVVFIESAGGGSDQETSDMRLYLSADYPVDAVILYHENDRIIPISIPRAHTSVEVDLDTLFGSGVELDSADQGITSKVFQIVTDEEVSDADLSVSGVSVRLYSSDAFLAFPTDVLGKDYVILSYPNGYNAGVGDPTDFDQPSEFAVIATEDNTDVEIAPSAPINDRQRLEPFTISLKAGEVFFAQAALGAKNDVSGTRVRSNKPVAVFAGNRRTSVPTEVGNFRDHLVEQMIPVERWGTSAIIPPFREITAAVDYWPVARVVAAYGDTQWKIDGVDQTPLQANQAVEVPMGEEPMVIEATAPIMVGAFEHSVGVQGGPEFALGDPFMMLVPAPEQYDTAYVFQSIGHELFIRHFINVIVPTDTEGSLIIDGVPFTVPMRPIPGTNFGYAQVEVTPGSHTITADVPFGLMVYGYGQANSYGFIGGMRLPERPAGVGEHKGRSTGLSMRLLPQPAREGSTTIDLTLDRPERISLALYSLEGEKVSDIIASRSFEPGTHRIEVDMSDLAAGTYLARLTTEAGEMVTEEIVNTR